jgi:hypothetical protein
MYKSKHSIISPLIGLILVFTFLACATTDKVEFSAKIMATPDKTVLTPALINKTPVVVTGSGWKPKEIVVVNMKLPEGVTVKGVNPGEDVGIASGAADDQGNLKTTLGPITILMTFFQADWDNMKMKPDFKGAKPLPPGDYALEAIGLDSGARAGTTLTLLPPPKKKE